MSDGSTLILLLLASTVSSTALGHIIAKRRPGWSKKRVVLLSALPIPGLLAVLLAFLFVHAFITNHVSPDRCGVDACGMVMAASMLGFMAIGLVFGAATIFAVLAARWTRR